MARVYSPASPPLSPYARAYESHGRTYASHRSGHLKKAHDYLVGYKGKNFRTGVLVVCIIALVLATFMTYLMKHDFTDDELSGVWGKFQKMIDFSKTERGQQTIYALWGVGGISATMLVYARCNKKQ